MRKPIEVLKEQGERSKTELPEAPRIQVLPPQVKQELKRTVEIMREGARLQVLDSEQLEKLKEYEVMLESGSIEIP